MESKSRAMENVVMDTTNTPPISKTMTARVCWQRGETEKT